MRKALVIVDMSNDFVHNDGNLTAGEPAQKITPYIVELAKEFIKNDDIVVIAMDAHQENDDHFKLWPEHNVVGTWGQKLYGDLATWYDENIGLDNLIYTPKENYNAFFNTNLAEDLKGAVVEEVHVVGVCTDICDFATIAGADANGFKTVLHKRGVATFTQNLPPVANMLKDGFTPADVFVELMKLSFHTKVVE